MADPASGHAYRAAALTGGPLTGIMRRWRQDALGVLREADATGADAIKFRLGPYWAMLVRHPDLVQHVLVDHQKNYEKRTRGYLKLRLVLGDGLLTSNGAHWLRQRRLAQPAFHRPRLAAFVDTFARAARDMTDAWEPHARDGTPLDVAVEMMQVALRVVGETLLSTDVSKEASSVGRSLTLVLGHTMKLITSMVPFEHHFPTAANLRFREALADLDRIVLAIIADRRRATSPPPDLLQTLLEARDEESGASMTDRELRDEVMTLFLAGHETTANALAWTLYQLSSRPEEQQRLADEVARVTGGQLVTIDHLSQLIRHDLVLKESMRLYPPVWILGRSAIEEDRIAGVRVPRGGFVFVSPWLTHRLPSVWSDPEAFVPERFEPERAKALPKCAYVPFSAGPRLCIGNHFAMMEAQVILATIFQRYRPRLVSPAPIVPETLTTLRPRGGMPMRLEPI